MKKVNKPSDKQGEGDKALNKGKVIMKRKIQKKGSGENSVSLPKKAKLNKKIPGKTSVAASLNKALNIEVSGDQKSTLNIKQATKNEPISTATVTKSSVPLKKRTRQTDGNPQVTPKSKTTPTKLVKQKIKVKSATAKVKSATAKVKSVTAKVKSPSKEAKSPTTKAKTPTVKVKTELPKVKSSSAKVKKTKSKAMKGSQKAPVRRGVVYFSHLPHGFFEDQIKDYCSQFGKVTGVYLPKSKKGTYRGYGFVEFQNPGVAQIVADTMNNYLMFNRLVKAEYIPPERQKPWIFRKKIRTIEQIEAKSDKEISVRTRHLSKAEEDVYKKRREKRVQALHNKLKAKNLDYSFQINNDHHIFAS